MSSIITAVFKASIGLLVNKGREVAAERLKDGDVTDQKFRGLIVREIDDINSKLDGLARKDLLASISFFKEGIEMLYEVFQKERSRREYGAITVQAAGTDSTVEAISLTNKMRMLELTGLDESTAKALAKAKDRFKDARREATRAFSNEALKLSDRVIAMQYRVMATILEVVDNPEEALSACRVCVEELHCLPAVKECFSVELKKGFRARFSKEERRKIISTVCHVNRVIHDIILMACFGREELSASKWPCVDIEGKKVDPLRDAGIVEVLQKEGMEHCCVPQPWAFGQEGEEKHKLKDPWGIATNSEGQFAIADNEDKTVKVFDSSGKFLVHFNPQTDGADKVLCIHNVATDVNNNIYVLVKLRKAGVLEHEREVQVFKTAGNVLRKFPVRRGRWNWSGLAVSNDKVLVSGTTDEDNYLVDVHELDGGYVRSFGEGILFAAHDIAADKDGRVVVLDRGGGECCVYVFTEDGTKLNKFNIERTGDPYGHWITCHPAGKHIIVGISDTSRFLPSHPYVEIYTTDGKFVGNINVPDDKSDESWTSFGETTCRGITATMKGHIAVAVRYRHKSFNFGERKEREESKVFVFENSCCVQFRAHKRKKK